MPPHLPLDPCTTRCPYRFSRRTFTTRLRGCGSAESPDNVYHGEVDDGCSLFCAYGGSGYLLANAWLKSATIFGGALLVGSFMGMVLGCVASFSRVLRGASLGISIAGLSLPDFLLVQLAWLLTIWTHRHFEFNLWSVTGAGKAPWLLPALVLAVAPMGYIARLTTNALEEVLLQDYIRTARAKGLRNWTVIMGHALRNALPQVLSGLPALVQITLSSLIIVEKLCSYPGLGAGLVDIIDSEVPALTAMIFCVWYVTMDGVAHTLRILVHPRLREVV